MTLDEYRALLERVSYRPGWELRVEDEWEGAPILTLCILAPVRDAYDPERRTVLDIRSPIPHPSGSGAFLAWLAWRLEEIERHESMEWLQLDGKPLRCQHWEAEV